MPASSAVWMIRVESSRSVLPQAPNIIVPRHSFDTWTPVRPRGRYSMGCSSISAGDCDVGRELHDLFRGLSPSGRSGAALSVPPTRPLQHLHPTPADGRARLA